MLKACFLRGQLSVLLLENRLIRKNIYTNETAVLKNSFVVR